MSGLLCGSLGASRIASATARIKSGWGASRANLMAELLVERLTELPFKTYISDEMQWGIDNEPLARTAYEFLFDCEAVQTEPIKHPKIIGAHASPDGLVGDVGLVEIKCPNTATHIETLLGAEIDGKYMKQMQWQLAVTGRHWCDYVSFDPRLPARMQLFTKRVARDDTMISSLEAEITAFLAELDAKVKALRSKYEEAKAA